MTAKKSKTYLKDSLHIQSNKNEIAMSGLLSNNEYRKVLAAIHNLTSNLGYQDIILNFELCTGAYNGAMLSLCCQAIQLRQKHIDTSISLPKESRLSTLFLNTNWAHFLEPRKYDPAKSTHPSQFPATQFSNSEDQAKIVNQLVEKLLSYVEGLNRADFAAIEWALNEVTDNVLNHSQSSVGGLVQLSLLKKSASRIEFAVSDFGIGIPKSLGTTRKLEDDLDALDQAIREGVTRDLNVGQGNGLFGTFEICRASKGRFRIDSGHASLFFEEKTGLRLKPESIPYTGTLIDAVITLGESGILDKALKFNGQAHRTTDYIEHRYEKDSLSSVDFNLLEECNSFGSRAAARPVRTKLKNIIDICAGQLIKVNFNGIPVISSSFADEVFGRLFLEMGPTTFMKRLDFINTNETVRNLIDRAISQRLINN